MTEINTERPRRSRLRAQGNDTNDILSRLNAKVIGQPQALSAIVPYVHMYQAGLPPKDDP